MYKLFIVDDEKLVRESLKTSIEWEEHGVCISGEAVNGKLALEALETDLPHIVITDIRMPIVDGLGLIKAIRQKNWNVKIIIISGYDDFCYAREAIELGAVGYILKPFENAEIIKMVDMAKKAMEEEEERKLRMDQLEQQVIQSIPFLRQKFFIELIRGLRFTGEEIREKLAFLKCELGEGLLTLLIVEIDNYLEYTREYDQLRLYLLKTALAETVENLMKLSFPGIAFEYDENQLIVVFNPDGADGSLPDARTKSKHQALELACKIQAEIEKQLQIRVSVGVSRHFESLTHLAEAFREAQAAIRDKFYRDKFSVIHIEDVDGSRSSSFFQSFQKEMEIITCIEAGDMEAVRRAIGEFYEELRQKAAGGISQVRVFSTGLVVRIEQFAGDLLQQQDLSRIDFQDCCKRIETSETMGEIVQEVASLAEQVIGNLYQKRHNKYLFLVEKAKGFIHANYYRDISLEEAAGYVEISSNYFSQLFKQYTGVNFVQYITDYRMSMAKKLLRNPELKIADIAYKVGYTDPKYFDKLFKKSTGVTPSEYREKPF